MVSIQESLSSNQRNMIPHQVVSSPHKRKWEGEERFNSISRPETKTSSFFDIGFNLQTPLPVDWKQCLDLQSGEIHYYNTKTRKRSCKDPRKSPEISNREDSPLRLDLELNLLPRDSFRVTEEDGDNEPDSRLSLNSITSTSPKESKKIISDSTLTRCTSWTSFDDDHKEMVAAVCMRCHMLVMLCKSSPVCPNCKFMHPPHQSSKGLFARLTSKE